MIFFLKKINIIVISMRMVEWYQEGGAAAYPAAKKAKLKTTRGKMVGTTQQRV